MGSERARYRGAVGLSFYAYPPCCGGKLTARSLTALAKVRAAHMKRCLKRAKAARARPMPAQQALQLEAPQR